MKIFISHKFRGKDKRDLKRKLKKIAFFLEKKRHNPFIYFRDKTSWKVKILCQGKVIKEAFKEIKKCDVFLCFIDEPELSEGMLLEIGFAKALNKKTVLLINEKYPRFTLRAIFDKVILFNRPQDIDKKLGRYF